MIDVVQRPDEATRTPQRACYWTATATVDGVEYVGRSRGGAIHELSRMLLGAGLPDDALRIVTVGLTGHMTMPSFHAAAQWTINGEGYRVRWEDPADLKARFGTLASGQNSGEEEGAATPLPDDASGP